MVSTVLQTNSMFKQYFFLTQCRAINFIYGQKQSIYTGNIKISSACPRELIWKEIVKTESNRPQKWNGFQYLSNLLNGSTIISPLSNRNISIVKNIYFFQKYQLDVFFTTRIQFLIIEVLWIFKFSIKYFYYVHSNLEVEKIYWGHFYVLWGNFFIEVNF